MPTKKLHESLKDEYEIIDDVVVVRKNYKFSGGTLDKEIDVGQNDIYVIPFYDLDDDYLVVQCEKRIRHKTLKRIASENNIKLGHVKILKFPDQDLHCFCSITAEIDSKHIVGYGETHLDNIDKDFRDYPLTIAINRATDNAISEFLGTDQLLTDSFSVKNLNKNVKTVDYNDLPPRKLSSINGDNKPTEKTNDKTVAKVLSDRELNTKKIMLMVNLVKDIPEEDIPLSIAMTLKIKAKTLDELSDGQLDEMTRYYYTRFKDADYLFGSLWDVILSHKEENEWDNDKFKFEVSGITNVGVESIPEDLNIADAWKIIEAWDLWK